MHRALAALHSAEHDLDHARCMVPTPLDPVQQDISLAVEGIYQAFSFNPPGSGN